MTINNKLILGGENLNNYKQENPIIMANDPFNQNFDEPDLDGIPF